MGQQPSYISLSPGRQLPNSNQPFGGKLPHSIILTVSSNRTQTFIANRPNDGVRPSTDVTSCVRVAFETDFFVATVAKWFVLGGATSAQRNLLTDP